MISLFGIGFTAPWLLLGLLALPLLWLLLRAVPPAARRQRFPAVTLLLGLRDDESLAHRTPWWLLLLRMAAVAAALIGFAGPVLNPSTETQRSGPLVILLDASWAAAPHWPQTQAQLEQTLTEAARADQPVALLRLTAPEPLQFQSGQVWLRQLAGLEPMPFQPSRPQTAQAADLIRAGLAGQNGAKTILWFSDGIDYEGRAPLTEALRALADLQVYDHGGAVMGLLPAEISGGDLQLTALRHTADADEGAALLALGPDPSGQERVLAEAAFDFAAGETEAQLTLALPSELRGRISRFALSEHASAGGVVLNDDRLRRRKVALVTAEAGNEGLVLLSELHYLRQALKPSADLLEGKMGDLLDAKPDVVILADVAQLPPAQSTRLQAWVQDGGLLLRFAGPRLAASDLARQTEAALMPVRLRSGGRSLGGAMSWGDPKSLAAFAETSPFFGLTVPAEVTVTSQVVAQPDPELADRMIAALADGTPLVTRKALGRGQVVLFHVTANTEWSSLPLSGLFVQMLERLSISSAAEPPAAADLEGTTWQPIVVLDGAGRLQEAGNRAGVAGPALAEAPVGPDLFPGLYSSDGRSLARNVLLQDSQLAPALWPAGIPLRSYAPLQERPLAGVFLSAALLLIALDVAAALVVSGLWRPARIAAIAAIAVPATLGAALLLTPAPGFAQTADAEAGSGSGTVSDTDPDRDAAYAALAADLHLGHILTGNRDVDEIAEAGLLGLSNVLRYRTSVEPAPPYGVDLERDELALFSFLYWPVVRDMPIPSSAAYDKLNDYLISGGMILFDTRDADLTTSGARSPAAARLQQLAMPLNIPPLAPLPADHVITRAFYLLKDFPGRHARGAVWVEASQGEAEAVEGLPFRTLNDGVTPVIIGSNDWAAAWAVSADNTPLYTVGRGFAGERQRELARRFGVNVIMHVLTGNYKSDQVHVPALLDRLGQ